MFLTGSPCSSHHRRNAGVSKSRASYHQIGGVTQPCCSIARREKAPAAFRRRKYAAVIRHRFPHPTHGSGSDSKRRRSESAWLIGFSLTKLKIFSSFRKSPLRLITARATMQAAPESPHFRRIYSASYDSRGGSKSFLPRSGFGLRLISAADLHHRNTADTPFEAL
jgi:hypothetical protein